MSVVGIASKYTKYIPVPNTVEGDLGRVARAMDTLWIWSDPGGGVATQAVKHQRQGLRSPMILATDPSRNDLPKGWGGVVPQFGKSCPLQYDKYVPPERWIQRVTQ